METFKAVVKRKEGLAVEAESRGFKIILDEPEEAGGTNTGMNPMELLLCSLGGCQTIAASMIAQQLDIDIEDFWVELEGDFDMDSLTGANPEAEKGYQNIRFNFHIKSDASEDKAKELIEMVEAVCPVGQTLLKNVKMNEAKITIEN